MIALLSALVAVVSLSLGFALGRVSHRPYGLTVLREHSRLTRKASRAYNRNQPGVANIYQEAAERLALPKGETNE